MGGNFAPMEIPQDILPLLIDQGHFRGRWYFASLMPENRQNTWPIEPHWKRSKNEAFSGRYPGLLLPRKRRASMLLSIIKSPSI